MSRKNLLLLAATHLLALGAAYSFARHNHPQTERAGEMNPPPQTKSPTRNLRSHGEGDGALLLAAFKKEQSEIKSRYEELKETLPVAKDLKAAAVEAFAKWKGSPNDEDAFSEMKVRILHWLRQNPTDAMDFIATASVNDSDFGDLGPLIAPDVFKEVIAEKGLLGSLPWLTKYPIAFALLRTATVDEMKAGGGFAIFLKLDSAVKGTPCEEAWQQATFLTAIGKVARFSEKERLLEYAKGLPTPGQQQGLLLGFSQSSGQAADWLLDLVEHGELETELASSLKGALGNEVLNTPTMDMDKRVAARRATKGNEKKFRETIIGEIVGGDINKLLVNGRDWRYEFRNGVSSLDDVVGAVRVGLPGIPSEGEEAMHIALYHQLSEENPDKALPLLDGLSEEKRREVLFSGTWNSYGNNNPDDFMSFLGSLPEPVTQKEKDDRAKGWDWKARGCLDRYGDDYVEWVKAMPPGADKDKAMNSLVWATREQNPTKARELSDQLYAKKP
ncbi:MAG: hypothetical protein ABIS50_24910 [Luteolibacter sp.]|uniref:hypothetical protein n=1 Tax=Luteolibacter sp. TaxID=1962973 RepID=UPI0032667406